MKRRGRPPLYAVLKDTEGLKLDVCRILRRQYTAGVLVAAGVSDQEIANKLNKLYRTQITKLAVAQWREKGCPLLSFLQT